MIAITHFTKRDLCDVRKALATQTALERTVRTPEGYERLRVLPVPPTKSTRKSEHGLDGVSVLLQYWHSAGNVEWFQNYQSMEEWENANR